MRSSGHDRVCVRLCQIHDLTLHLFQDLCGDIPQFLKGYHLGHIHDIMGGRADMQVFSGLANGPAVQSQQRDQGLLGLNILAPVFFHIDVFDIIGSCNIGCCLRRNDPHFRLAFCQSRFHVHPQLQPVLIGKDPADFLFDRTHTLLLFSCFYKFAV